MYSSKHSVVSVVLGRRGSTPTPKQATYLNTQGEKIQRQQKNKMISHRASSFNALRVTALPRGSEGLPTKLKIMSTNLGREDDVYRRDFRNSCLRQPSLSRFRACSRIVWENALGAKVPYGSSTARRRTENLYTLRVSARHAESGDAEVIANAAEREEHVERKHHDPELQPRRS